MNPAYPAFALLGLIWGTNFLLMKWASVFISSSRRHRSFFYEPCSGSLRWLSTRSSRNPCNGAEADSYTPDVLEEQFPRWTGEKPQAWVGK